MSSFGLKHIEIQASKHGHIKKPTDLIFYRILFMDIRKRKQYSLVSISIKLYLNISNYKIVSSIISCVYRTLRMAPIKPMLANCLQRQSDKAFLQLQDTSSLPHLINGMQVKCLNTPAALWIGSTAAQN